MFFHNESKIEGFSGTIVVDSKSNRSVLQVSRNGIRFRYFNVSVYGASGKINGVVKYSTNADSDEIFAFSAYVHDLQVILEIYCSNPQCNSGC